MGYPCATYEIPTGYPWNARGLPLESYELPTYEMPRGCRWGVHWATNSSLMGYS